MHEHTEKPFKEMTEEAVGKAGDWRRRYSTIGKRREMNNLCELLNDSLPLVEITGGIF